MTDIAGAEKKLRQASFFLGYLECAPREMRRDPNDPGTREQLEFYFSACLSAAQSVYYVLDKTGGATFKAVERRWRGDLPGPERSRFGRMIGLRDNDVHLASTGAEPLHKLIPEDPSRYVYFDPTVDVEVENPDGTKVHGSVLRGTVGLSIEQQGRRVEAAEACREFIRQLGSLLDEVKAGSAKT